MSMAKVGAITCRAGRGTKCVHKRNARIVGGSVKCTTCAIDADSDTCTYAGKALIQEAITGDKVTA